LRVSYVKFWYKSPLGISEPDMPPALDLQAEMVIEPGRRYALIGQNRAGKSTLNNILVKLYSPDSGTITLDGVPYSEISRTSLRSFITYVSQRPFIFPGTIRDNILVGNPDASEEEVEAAAEAAGVFAFAEAAGMSWYKSPRSPYVDSNTQFQLYRNGHPYSTENLNMKVVEEEESEGEETEGDSASDRDTDGDESGDEKDPLYDPENSEKKEKRGKKKNKLDKLEKELEESAKAKLEIEKEIENEDIINSEKIELDEIEREGYGVHGSDGEGSSPSVATRLSLKDALLNKDINLVFTTKPTKPKLSKLKSRKHPKKRTQKPHFSIDPNASNNNSGSISNSYVNLPPTNHTLPTHNTTTTNPLYSSDFYIENKSLHSSNYNLNENDISPVKSKGWMNRWFGPKLPYAFPRAYPGDSDDEEDAPARPPPVVPHKSGPHSSHPVLDQEIEARGQNVSGGFAQSIALARIFVRHSTKILILDEAMSQMDAYKKREIIFPKLFEFSRKNEIALIIITHDLLSIQDVDHVFVLDQGVLVHQGAHKELLEQKAEVYMRLLGV